MAIPEASLLTVTLVGADSAGSIGSALPGR